MTVNCAAIQTLLEGELFGYERGAFTGAVGRRIGKFGRPTRDDLPRRNRRCPIEHSGEILRVLQETTFERLGGNETIVGNVRMLAATNRDLKSKSTTESSANSITA